jgi:uncharacterized protein YndB with AHSA1/START domain
MNMPDAAVVVRRTIAATPERLFDAWLDPIALAAWMRPGEVRSTVASLDPRVGGAYEIVMTSSSDTYSHRGVYRAIERPRRLVFTWKSGPTQDCETLVTVDFLPQGKSTEVVVTHELLPDSARASHGRGWTGGLEKLAQHFAAH